MDLVLCLQYYNFFFLFGLFPLPMVYLPVYITLYSCNVQLIIVIIIIVM